MYKVSTVAWRGRGDMEETSKETEEEQPPRLEGTQGCPGSQVKRLQDNEIDDDEIWALTWFSNMAATGDLDESSYGGVVEDKKLD